MKLKCPNKQTPDFNIDCVVFKCEEGQLLIGRFNTSKLWYYVWWCFASGKYSSVGLQYNTKAEIKFNAKHYAITQWGAKPEEIIL